MNTKICHVTSAHPRYDGRIFDKECNYLDKAGYTVFLIVNDEFQNEKTKNIEIISTNQKVSSRRSRIKNLKKIYQLALSTKADIYHLHDPELLLMALKLKKKDKKVIFDSHEYYYSQIGTKEYLPKALRGIIAKIYYLFETYICKKIDGVICVDTLTINGEVVGQFDARAKRVQLIANYPMAIKTKHVGSDKGLTVVYAGGLSHERGITHLITACFNAGAKLALAGNFSSDKYLETLKSKESYQCVDYKGALGIDQVYRLYAQSDIGAATLLDSGQYCIGNSFPTKVYEYFQFGIPVIISNYPYSVEMNEKYDYGICVEPDNVEEIAAAIHRLTHDKGLSKKLGQNGNALYQEKFKWEEEGDKLLSFYKKILGE